MAALQPVRGTHDLLPDEARRFRFIVEEALRIAGRYGYGEIATPVFEFSEVFHRTLGDTSDVVTKETYTFQDRGGESLTLRPEFTAGIARAFLSNGLKDQLPLKFFYAGPAFRYERPQKGRQRQFHQIGTELLGVAEPQGDIESIALAHHVLKALDLESAVTLEINSLGDKQSREGFRVALLGHLRKNRERLSEDSKTRLERNPLRVLDSKDPQDQPIVAEAMALLETSSFFTSASQAHYDEVKEGLTALGVSFKENRRMVRGLDYYNDTVFEFTTDRLGAQGTVLAGGRYDGLMEIMGGPPTPGIGWAAGVERLAALMDICGTAPPKPPRAIALIPLGDGAEKEALASAQWLRKGGFHVELGYKGNLANRMKKANKANACAAIIFGEAELAKGVVALKDLDKGEQREVALKDLAAALAPYREAR